MSSDKKQDEETGAEEPRPDEIENDARTAGRDGDEGQPDGIEDAEILGEVVADGSRFDHDEPRDDDATEGATEDTPTPDDDMMRADGSNGDADGKTADEVGDEPDAVRPYAPDDAEPMSVASATPDAGLEPSPEPAPAAARAKSGGGFMPALFGGVVAAGLGFGAAHFDVLGMGGADPVTQSLTAQGDRLGGLEQQIAALTESLGAADSGAMDQVTAQLGEISDSLATQLGDVATSVGSVRDDLGSAITGVATRLGDLDTQLTGVAERLSAVEQRPLTESSEASQAAFGAYERDIANLQDQVAELQAANTELSAAMKKTTEDAQAEIEAAEARAAEAQKQAEADAQLIAQKADTLARASSTREGLAYLETAIEKGAPFETAMASLSNYTEIPEVLSSAAATGVESMATLRETFDQAARDALNESIRATVEDDPTGRVTSFLRAQTGLRSLAPKEGDDPDAVLSRADAAVEIGDLETALSELEALPEPGQAAMADWVAQAKARLAVTQAAATLTDTLLAN